MKIVITGAPFSGKTTLRKILARNGYPAAWEAAIEVIKSLDRLLGSKKALEWRSDHFDAFQHAISLYQKNLEETDWSLEPFVRATKGGPVFYDRGSLDGIAFAEHFNQEISDTNMELIKSSKYDAVFILDLVKPFDDRRGTGRIDTEEDCLALDELLEKVYVDHGYNVIRVPLMPVEDRAKFVFKKLGFEWKTIPRVGVNGQHV